MVLAGTWDVREPPLINVLTLSTVTTSFTWPLRTQTVAITSRRNSSSMDFRETCYQLLWVVNYERTTMQLRLTFTMWLDGSSARRLRNELTPAKFHPHRRVWLAEGTCRISSHLRQKRWTLQLVLQVERNWRVHQHLFLVQSVQHAAWWRGN